MEIGSYRMAVFNADLRSTTLKIAARSVTRLDNVDWQFVSWPPGGNSMYYDATTMGGPGDVCSTVANTRAIKSGFSAGPPASCNLRLRFYGVDRLA